MHSEPHGLAAASGGSDVFFIDGDETIKHYWRNAGSARWSGFEQLDGLARDIAAVELSERRFEVFVVGTDGDLWSNRQLDRGLWSGFRPMHFASKQVAIAKTPSGHFELFVIGQDDAVWRSVRNGPDGQWSDWQGLGGVASQLAAAAVADEAVRVFAVGSDRAIWSTPSDNVAWQSLGGNVSDVSVGRAADSSSMLYAIGTGGTIWQRRALDAGSQFGGWQQLAGTAKQLSASGAGLFAQNIGVAELQANGSRWQALSPSSLPLDATFVGVATMEIPSLNVTQKKQLRIGVRFSADRRRVQVTAFPAFTTHGFQTPFGKSRTTVSLKSGGSGTFDPETGKLELHVTLHLDQSLDVPIVQEDADVVLTLSTDGDGGQAIGADADLARVGLAASSRFVTGGGLNPLNKKTCRVTIQGWLPLSGQQLRAAL
ncbi:MAG TPA: hypothetical protein VFN67_21985 [Polyangiales bacterium]|nr:hypothetical protein [Polyangiales bacterium]